MRKPVSSLVVLLLLAVPFAGGIAAVAYAADLCLTLGDGAAELALQDVGGGKDGKDINKDLAKPNKCKQVSGFFGNGLFANAFATASICTSSHASHATVIANFLGGSMQTQFPLPISSLGSSDIVSVLGDESGIPTTAAVCVPPSVPVP